MFSHVMIGSNDVGRSKAFYDALFAAIGGKPGRRTTRAVSSTPTRADFMVSRPIDGEPATRANGGTIGFAVDSPDPRRPGTGGMRQWRHRDRRAAGPAQGVVRRAVPRLSPRSGRQQALRGASRLSDRERSGAKSGAALGTQLRRSRARGNPVS